MPNKQGDQKFDCPCPKGLSFCGQTWTFDIGLVMQKESRTWGNSSFWVKTYIHVANLGFLCFTFLIWLCITRSLFSYSSSIGRRGELNNNIGNFMASGFYLVVNSTGWGKNGLGSFLPQVYPIFIEIVR